jgi:membrane protein DedA with SNARE-associated domain
MQEHFHALLKTWFHFVEVWGYLGVFLLMAMESSIIPIPSEIIMPPAAYWAAQGRMSFWLVVLAGTAGSWFGSIVSYVVARVVGEPVVRRYGKYFFISEAKVTAMEGWVAEYGVPGIFFARLLPVVRHLISIPAGILKMPVGAFSAATTTGAFLWCAVLSWFGMKVIGDAPQLLDSPAELARALKAKMHLVVVAVVLFAAAYAVMAWLKKRATKTSISQA